MLTDERIKELIGFSGDGHSSNLPEWRRGTVKRDVAEALHELLRIRRDGYAPDGKVLVDEEDQRALVYCSISQACATCKLDATCNTDDRLGALLAHFGLAPEPEAPQ